MRNIRCQSNSILLNLVLYEAEINDDFIEEYDSNYHESLINHINKCKGCQSRAIIYFRIWNKQSKFYNSQKSKEDRKDYFKKLKGKQTIKK